MPARAAISSLVAGTSIADGLPARRYRGDLPPEPLDRGQGGAGQPVGTQARDGDEDGAADGKLTHHLALGGVVRFE